MVSYHKSEFAVSEALAELNNMMYSHNRYQENLAHLEVALSPTTVEAPPQKKKRTRTVYSAYQLSELECEFQRNMYMFRRHRSHLAKRLNLRETQVKVWFQNRRMRLKRELKAFHEKNFEANASITQSATNAHKEIVKRLMSYTRDPAALQRQSKLPVGRTADQSLRATTSLLPTSATDSSQLPDISKARSFAEVSASPQGVSFELKSPATFDPCELDLILQSIR